MSEVNGNMKGGEKDDPWEVTSLRLKRSTKRAVKIYAAEQGETMQSVLEKALRRLLAEKRGDGRERQ